MGIRKGRHCAGIIVYIYKNMKKEFIVTIGRPSYQKNSLFLVDVIKRVHEKHPEVQFYLLGVGFYSPDLEEMKVRLEEYGLNDTVVMKEWADHDTTMQYVKDSILYLTVSRYEGLPLAVVEAMALSKCIVASRVVGNVDCVRDGYNGRVLELNEKVFADAINDLLDHPDKIAEYGKNSRELYEKEFDIKKRIGMLEDIYNKVAKK